MFRSVLLTTVCYIISGAMGVWLFENPIYAHPVWPAAGIALGFMLVYGHKIWPGIMIGAFFIEIIGLAQPITQTTLVQSAASAGLLSVGPTLQALLGTFLIKKYVKSLELIDLMDIIKFFFFGGVLACLAGTLIRIGILILYRFLLWDIAIVSGGITWVGETIGVILIVPSVFLFIAPSDGVWSGHRRSLKAPLIISLIVILCALRIGYKLDNVRIKEDFINKTNTLFKAVESQLNELYIVLRSVQSFFKSSDFVSRKEFKSYLENIIPDFPEIKSISWIPQVKKEDKNAFIQKAVNEGYPDYFIKEVGFDGSFKKAGERDIYFPIFYIEPEKGNERALGIDNSSEPGRLKTSLIARDKNIIISSPPIILAQDKETGHKSIILAVPIYAKNSSIQTVEDRRKYLTGFTTVAARMKDLFAGAFAVSSNAKNIDIFAIDVDQKESKVVFESALYNQDKKWAVSRNIEIKVSGRLWNMLFLANNHYFINYSRVLWFQLIGILPVSILLSAFFLYLTGQTQVIAEMVNERTKELKLRTEQLEKNKINLKNEVSLRTKELVQIKDELEGQVVTRIEELNRRIKDMERMNRVMVGRENRMIELKKTIKQLQEKIEQLNQRNDES